MYLRSWNMFITSIDHVYQAGHPGNTAAVPNYDNFKFEVIVAVGERIGKGLAEKIIQTSIIVGRCFQTDLKHDFFPIV